MTISINKEQLPDGSIKFTMTENKVIDTNKYIEFVRQTTSPASSDLAALLARITDLEAADDDHAGRPEFAFRLVQLVGLLERQRDEAEREGMVDDRFHDVRVDEADRRPDRVHDERDGEADDAAHQRGGKDDLVDEGDFRLDDLADEEQDSDQNQVNQNVPFFHVKRLLLID